MSVKVRAASLSVLTGASSEARTFSVTLPGASRLLINDVSVSPAGGLTISGSATSPEGAAAGVTVLLSAAGGVQRVIRTAAYVPWSLCFAADGTLWAAGSEHDDSYKERPEYDVLRHYSVDGVRIGSALGVASLTRKPGGYPAMASTLVASSNRIGFHSGFADEWVELSLSGAVLGRWKTQADGPLTGAVITPGGDAYVSIQYPQNRSIVYRLDRDANRWAPVNSGTSKVIFGADGEFVVMGLQPASVDWVKLD